MIGRTTFTLRIDKQYMGEKGVATFLEAGTYDVVRLFDQERVLVASNLGKPRQVTLLRLKDGQLS